MRRQRGIPNYREADNVDCTTCYLRTTCEHAQENSFCTRWARKAPETEGPDPNELWKQGEDVSF